MGSTHHVAAARRRRALKVLGAALALSAAGALAQTAAPMAAAGAPLRLVVPFTPGTGIDLIARTVGPRLAERLARPVIVENRAGASGNLGTEAVVRAAPDGSTLLVSVNTMVMNRALFRNLSFDPVRDLEAVTLTSWGQLVLVASRASGIRDAGELVARARAHPGRINYGSPGNGTPHHLAMELLKNQNAVFMTHIPYCGTGPAVTDLLGGQIDVMFLPIHVALQHIRAGSLAGLAIGSVQPHALLPEVPPLKAAGLGDVDVDMWYGVFVPRGTPADTTNRLNRELRDILAQPEVRTAFEAQGMTPASSTPSELQALMARDAARWAAVVQAQSIKPD